MNTTITIRTSSKLKNEAQAVVADLGFTLSSVINAYLKKLVKTKTVSFSVDEKPSPYMIKLLKKAENDIKKGNVSPAFDNISDALKWLNK